jgi:hypothetical protein
MKVSGQKPLGDMLAKEHDTVDDDRVLRQRAGREL